MVNNNIDIDFPCQLSKYTLLRKLGTGAFSIVFLALDKETNLKYAIKALILDDKDDTQEQKLKKVMLFKNEVIRMKDLNHPNILKYVDSQEFQELIYMSGIKVKKMTVSIIVTEFAENGELFYYVSQNMFQEKTARFYFKQLISGLEYLHSKSIVHRDLKLNNLLIDNEYNLKIADFGFASSSSGREGSGFCETACGTIGYMAPEILHKHPYNGVATDVFACGVILFLIISKHPPFMKAQNDNYYQKLLTDSDKYWQINSMNKPEKQKFYSDQFKELFQFMVDVDPIVRPSIAELKAHSWYSGLTSSQEEITQEFAERISKKNMKKKHWNNCEQNENSEETKCSEAGGNEVATNKKRYRSRSRERDEINRRLNNKNVNRDFNNRGDDDDETMRILERYDGTNCVNTEIFSENEPEDIIKQIIDFCNSDEYKNDYQYLESKEKFNIILYLGSITDENEKSEVLIRILGLKDGSNCAEFTLLNGDYFEFQKLFGKFEEIL